MKATVRFTAQITPLDDNGRPCGPVLYELDVELTVSIDPKFTNYCVFTVEEVFCLHAEGPQFDMLTATDPLIAGLGRRIKAEAEIDRDLREKLDEEYFGTFPSDRWAA